MAANLKDMAIKQLKAMAPKFTLMLRKDAVAAGWPAKCVNKLTVVVTSDGITIEYPEDLAEEIEDLEYGTYTTSPSPVMRSFIERHTEELGTELANSTIEYLLATDVIP